MSDKESETLTAEQRTVFIESNDREFDKEAFYKLPLSDRVDIARERAVRYGLVKQS